MNNDGFCYCAIVGVLTVLSEGWFALYELLNKYDQQVVLTEATIAITIIISAANHGNILVMLRCCYCCQCCRYILFVVIVSCSYHHNCVVCCWCDYLLL